MCRTTEKVSPLQHSKRSLSETPELEKRKKKKLHGKALEGKHTRKQDKKDTKRHKQGLLFVQLIFLASILFLARGFRDFDLQ